MKSRELKSSINHVNIEMKLTIYLAYSDNV